MLAIVFFYEFKNILIMLEWNKAEEKQPKGHPSFGIDVMVRIYGLASMTASEYDEYKVLKWYEKRKNLVSLKETIKEILNMFPMILAMKAICLILTRNHLSLIGHTSTMCMGFNIIANGGNMKSWLAPTFQVT
jgi:hypothetical protein